MIKVAKLMVMADKLNSRSEFHVIFFPIWNTLIYTPTKLIK